MEQASPTGTHSFMVSGHRFDVDTRYHLMRGLGQGAYGVVCSALDSVTNKKVAIKKTISVFESHTVAKRTLREIKLLRHFHHDNIISIKDIIQPQSRNFNEVYVVSELMDTDLQQIIKSPQLLTDEHIQYFVYQLLRGLKCIHSAHVIHRDLKPGNLLVNHNCDLKICDFGLGRSAIMQPELTEYVTTRWYRAPEVLLCSDTYSYAIDVWAAGCILYEMLTRRPLFPGKEYLNQINLILDRLGTPTEEDIQNIRNNKARDYISNLPKRSKLSFALTLPRETNPLAIDLLEKMLVFDPPSRITVHDALRHPYLARLHDAEDEPIALAPFEFELDNERLTLDMLRDLMFEEILDFRGELPPR